MVLGKIHVIGNPPFGKQSSLCHKFIKHCATFADSFSFILPLAFKKDSNLEKIPLKFHLAGEILLPPDSFQLGYSDYKIPTVFQLWVKTNTLRNLKKKEVPRRFYFTLKVHANVAVTRVGCRAGALKLATVTNLQALNENTHYFLRADEELLRVLRVNVSLISETTS